MARGRKPKPTQLRLDQGNPGRKKISPDEPTPNIIAPKCPHHLTPFAKREWNRITPLLLKLGLLSQLDMASIAAYCQVYDRWRKAETKVRRHGELIVINSMGYLQQNPWLNIANKSLDQMKVFYAEFGLTPSARTKLRVMTSIIDRPQDHRDPDGPTAPPPKPHQPHQPTIMTDLLGSMDGVNPGQTGDT